MNDQAFFYCFDGTCNISDLVHQIAKASSSAEFLQIKATTNEKESFPKTI